MPINISASFAFQLDQPTDVLLQFEAAAIPEQRIVDYDCWMTEAEHLAYVPAQDDIGRRAWVRAQGLYKVDYRASVEVNRIVSDVSTLDRLAPHELPGEVVPYLFDSRYCPADSFQHFAEADFGELRGGARIAAMRDWIEESFDYVPGSSNASTTGLETFVERSGICRDYAHVMIMLARASAIPARYVSLYDPGVDPMDFHAVAEVFLADPEVEGGGAWHLVDATGMADPRTSVKIGVGRDAADVSFLTSFGKTDFREKDVSVTIGE